MHSEILFDACFYVAVLSFRSDKLAVQDEIIRAENWQRGVELLFDMRVSGELEEEAFKGAFGLVSLVPI